MGQSRGEQAGGTVEGGPCEGGSAAGGRSRVAAWEPLRGETCGLGGGSRAGRDPRPSRPSLPRWSRVSGARDSTLDRQRPRATSTVVEGLGSAAQHPRPSVPTPWSSPISRRPRPSDRTGPPCPSARGSPERGTRPSTGSALRILHDGRGPPAGRDPRPSRPPLPSSPTLEGPDPRLSRPYLNPRRGAPNNGGGCPR